MRHAHIITTKTTTKMKTTNDDCVGIRGNKKRYGRWETHMSKVSQPPAGPRIRAVQWPEILLKTSILIMKQLTSFQKFPPIIFPLYGHQVDGSSININFSQMLI